MRTSKASFRQSPAFTLMELLISLSVLAVLAAWGFPSIEESVRNNRMSAQNNELLSMFYYARSEAIATLVNGI